MKYTIMIHLIKHLHYLYFEKFYPKKNNNIIV